MSNDSTLPTPGAMPLTMSSLEIADRTGKEHAHVMRDIRAMLASLQDADSVSQSKFGGTYLDAQGKERPCYRLPKRECLILTSGYSVELRAAIIDRWMELEAGTSAANVSFMVPRSLSEALRLAADQAEKIERQNAQITAMAPKAEFHDNVAEAINCQTVEEVAKILGTGQNRLFAWLRAESILMKSNRPYQRFVDEGYFRVVERAYKDNRGEAHTYTRTLVTGKGLAYIQRRFVDAA